MYTVVVVSALWVTVIEDNSVAEAFVEDAKTLLSAVLREVTVLCKMFTVLCNEVAALCNEVNWELIVDNCVCMAETFELEVDASLCNLEMAEFIVFNWLVDEDN